MTHFNELRGSGGPLTVDQIKLGFQQTFDVLQNLKQQAGFGDEVSTYNMMITDGYRIFGTRFSSDPEKQSPTLYYSSGNRFHCEDGIRKMVQDASSEETILIASEKLNGNKNEWTCIPPNHFIAVENNMEIGLSPLDKSGMSHNLTGHRETAGYQGHISDLYSSSPGIHPRGPCENLRYALN